MNADWYYLKRRWYGGSKKIGPLHEHELLHRIDLGEITPETLLMSSKTRQHWVKMSEVKPAMAHWRLLQQSIQQHSRLGTTGHGSPGHSTTGHGTTGHSAPGQGATAHGSPGKGHGPANLGTQRTRID